MKSINKFASLVFLLLLACTSCKDEKNEGDDTAAIETRAVTKDNDIKMATSAEKISISKNEIPAVVSKSFMAKSPKAKDVKYSRIVKPVAGSETYDTIYYFDFDNDGYRYWLTYDKDGKLIPSTSTYPKIKGVPDLVSQSVAEYFPGYKVVEIDKDNDKDIDIYELELQKGEEKVKIKYTPDGGVLKLKR